MSIKEVEKLRSRERAQASTVKREGCVYHKRGRAVMGWRARRTQIRAARLPKTTQNSSSPPEEKVVRLPRGVKSLRGRETLLPIKPRPKSSFCSPWPHADPSWNSPATFCLHSLREIRKLERIQRRAKNMIKESKNRTQETS